MIFSSLKFDKWWNLKSDRAKKYKIGEKEIDESCEIDFLPLFGWKKIFEI